MSVTHAQHQDERPSSGAVRMVMGVGAFAWAAYAFSSRIFWPKPYWPVHLIGGAVLGAVATIVTRNAGRRTLGRFLAALGYVSVGMIAAVLLWPSGGCVYVEFLPHLVLPAEKFFAITMLPITAWLFLSSRAGRRGSR